jgi:alpha-mannosidase
MKRSLVFLFALVLHAASVVSQTSGAPDPYKATLDRLGALTRQAETEWRFHDDVPHPEDPWLNDSGWGVFKVKNENGPGGKNANEEHWSGTRVFRRWIQIPEKINGYPTQGSRVSIDLRFGSPDSLKITVFSNEAILYRGSDDDILPMLLSANTQPGQKFLVAARVVGGDAVQSEFFHSELMIEPPHTRPDPAFLRTEILAARPIITAYEGGKAERQKELDAAVKAVDFSPLDRGDQAGFDASLKQTQVKLEVLKPWLQHFNIRIVGNSHIDMAWLWPWTETVEVVRNTFQSVLDLMREYPDFKFTMSSARTYEWMQEKYPDLFKQIEQRVKEGRWEIIGGMWVEPDLNMPDGESLVRQLLVGKRWYKQAYGVDVRIGWNPDSFGYTWQLPQIYKKSGVDYFVTQKMTWNDTNQLPFKLFWWESPDGSKVLSYFPHDYANNNLSPVRLSNDLATARKRATGMTDMMDLYGIGDHGGGPTRAILDQGFHWAQPSVPPKVMPNIQFGTAQTWFSTVEKLVAPESKEWNYQSIAKGYTAPPAPAVAGEMGIPTWKSELYFEYHRGVMTTQANHKKNMRDSEEEVLNAEKWASLAWLDGRAYPGSELTEDWKKVLFNQFHDLAAGSGIGVIYKDAQKDYDVVRWSTNEIGAGALGAVAERINTQTKAEKAIPVIVYNSLGWERSGYVTVQAQLPAHSGGIAIREVSKPNVPIRIHVLSRDPQDVVSLSFDAARIPPFGYKVFQLLVNASIPTQDPPADVPGTAIATLENDILRVVVDKSTGCITSLFDKRSDFETLASGACGNQLQFFKDAPKDYDAWNIDPGTLDVSPSLIDRADSVELVDKHLIDSSIRVTRHWQNSKFVQTIRLSDDSDQVDIENDIDWHESHVLLKAAFPLAASGPFATYEIPYGSIDRPTTRNNSWEKAQFEVPAMRWADLGDGKHGLSVINNSKYGYDAAGNVLRLTLLRSAKWPDPEADMGHHHFHYALYPHAGTWKDALTVRHGYEYNYPLTAVVTTAHVGSLPAEHSFASVAPENVVLTAVKKAEDANGLIFRVYEWAGKDSTVEFHVPPGATSATVTNLMETPEGLPLGVVGDVVKAHEILTIRVDYPPAVGQTLAGGSH